MTSPREHYREAIDRAYRMSDREIDNAMAATNSPVRAFVEPVVGSPATAQMGPQAVTSGERATREVEQKSVDLAAPIPEDILNSARDVVDVILYPKWSSDCPEAVRYVANALLEERHVCNETIRKCWGAAYSIEIMRKAAELITDEQGA